MITIRDDEIKVTQYLDIRACVGWRMLTKEQAQKALDNSLLTVGAYDGNKLVGMGRLVGDGAVICYIQDLIVDPDYQHKGVGSQIIDALITHVKHLRSDNTTMMLCLMCAKGRESFYENHGFVARPTDSLGPGMIQYLLDE